MLKDRNFFITCEVISVIDKCYQDIKGVYFDIISICDKLRKILNKNSLSHIGYHSVLLH